MRNLQDLSAGAIAFQKVKVLEEQPRHPPREPPSGRCPSWTHLRTILRCPLFPARVLLSRIQKFGA
jgi:hypothetical protein